MADHQVESAPVVSKEGEGNKEDVARRDDKSTFDVNEIYRGSGPDPNAARAEKFVKDMQSGPEASQAAIARLREALNDPNAKAIDKVNLLGSIGTAKEAANAPFALEVKVNEHENNKATLVDVDITTREGSHDLYDGPGGELRDKFQNFSNKFAQVMALSMLEQAKDNPEAAPFIMSGMGASTEKFTQLLNDFPKLKEGLTKNMSEAFKGSGMEDVAKELVDTMNGKPPGPKMQEFFESAKDEQPNSYNPEDRLAMALRVFGDFALTPEQKASKASAEKSLSQTNPELMAAYHAELERALASGGN